MALDADILPNAFSKTNREARVDYAEKEKKALINVIRKKLFVADDDELSINQKISFLESLNYKVIDSFDFLLDFDKRENGNGVWLQNKRNNGELSAYHPLSVLKILTEEFGFEKNDARLQSLYVATILHDVYEDKREGKGMIFWRDNGNLLKEIRRRFGRDVFEMLEGLTKFKSEGEVDDKNTYDNVMQFAILFPGILKIKLADRLHNWRTIEGMSLKKKLEAVRETKEFFLPIAEKLGMSKVVEQYEKCIEKVRDELRSYNAANEVKMDINLDNMYDITPWWSQTGLFDRE